MAVDVPRDSLSWPTQQMGLNDWILSLSAQFEGAETARSQATVETNAF